VGVLTTLTYSPTSGSGGLATSVVRERRSGFQPLVDGPPECPSSTEGGVATS
jgi:hypothetical protein